MVFLFKSFQILESYVVQVEYVILFESKLDQSTFGQSQLLDGHFESSHPRHPFVQAITRRG